MNKFFISTFLVFWSFLSFSQSVLYKIEIDELLDHATLVVEAKVVEKKSYRSLLDNHIYTLNTLKILGVFKGEITAEEIQVITKGGSIGFEKEVLYPSLKLRTGNIGLFTLKESPHKFYNENSEANYYEPTHSLQSFFKYQIRSNEVSNPFNSFNNIEEFQSFMEDQTGNYSVIEQFTTQYASKSAKILETPIISSFAPTSVRAGIGQEISIIGENFGDQIGGVAFRDADDGGFSSFLAYNSAITKWTNTNIIIKVPSLAGTGSIEVINSEGEFVISDSILTVLSSEINAEFDSDPSLLEQEFRAKFYNDNDNGGYTWTFDDDFYANSDAVDAFTVAVETWVCETNINWTISENTLSETTVIPSETSGTDAVNLVSFGNIDSGALAVTLTHYSGCFDEATGEVTSYVEEVDITFSSSRNWHYGEGILGAFDYDFLGTAVHELGHAHNLGHVIAPNNLMHFATEGGENSATRDIDENSSEGASRSYEFSKTPGLCGQQTAYDRACTEDGEIIIGQKVIVQGGSDLIVLNSAPIVSLKIYDIQGRVVISNTFMQTDISSLSTGIYIVHILENNGEITIEKILKP